MRPPLAWHVGPWWIVSCVALGGCGGAADSLPRQAVSGAVTLDGRPLARGSIQFQPASQNGVAAGAEIKDGKYAIPRDQGPIPGEYKVIISSASATAPTPTGPPGQSPPPPPDLIPARYNAESTLTATVEADKPNTFDFPLTK